MPLTPTQNRACDIVERLNEMEVDWLDILIPLIANDESVAEYFIYNYDDIADGDF